MTRVIGKGIQALPFASRRSFFHSLPSGPEGQIEERQIVGDT